MKKKRFYSEKINPKVYPSIIKRLLKKNDDIFYPKIDYISKKF